MTVEHLPEPVRLNSGTGKALKISDTVSRLVSRNPVRKLTARLTASLREINDYTNAVGLLVDEANERASKPWNQRAPGD